MVAAGALNSRSPTKPKLSKSENGALKPGGGLLHGSAGGTHIRIAAKRAVLEGIVVQAGAGVNQNVNQQPQIEITPPSI